MLTRSFAAVVPRVSAMGAIRLLSKCAAPIKTQATPSRAFSSVSSYFDACQGQEKTITNMYYGGVNLYFGPGSIHKLTDIIKQYGVHKVGLVADPIGYKACGAWPIMQKIFADQKVEVVIYDQFKANPYVDDVEACVAKFRSENITHVLAIGGGSALDAGKAVSLLLKNPGMSCGDLMEQKFNALNLEALPLICVNTTHGTGTEVNHFAVITIKQGEHDTKPAIAFKSIFPTASIDDPNLAVTLPRKQTIYTSVDALNHVMEAASTPGRNPFSIMVGRQVYEIVAKYLPIALQTPSDVTARYWLHFAAAMAGAAFDSCGLHLTHALEHPMSAVKHDLAHGLGLAVLQPSVLKAVYPACAKELAYIMAPIMKTPLNGTPDEALSAAQQLESWLESVGIPEKMGDLGFSEADCQKLTDNFYSTTFCVNLAQGCSPVPPTPELIKGIFQESLKPLRK